MACTLGWSPCWLGGGTVPEWQPGAGLGLRVMLAQLSLPVLTVNTPPNPQASQGLWGQDCQGLALPVAAWLLLKNRPCPEVQEALQSWGRGRGRWGVDLS